MPCALVQWRGWGGVRRVAVIGCPGAGKSTFARRLGVVLGIEVVHLDRLYWHPGWVRTPAEQWAQIQAAALQADRWIVDGNYAATLHLRVTAADTVIFLDFPRAVCLWRSLLRVARSRRTTRPDMADGCRERVNLEFLRFIWSFRRAKRPGMVRRLREVQGDKHVVYLRSSGEADAFLARARQRAMLSADP